MERLSDGGMGVGIGAEWWCGGSNEMFQQMHKKTSDTASAQPCLLRGRWRALSNSSQTGVNFMLIGTENNCEITVRRVGSDCHEAKTRAAAQIAALRWFFLDLWAGISSLSRFYRNLSPTFEKIIIIWWALLQTEEKHWICYLKVFPQWQICAEGRTKILHVDDES